MLVAFLLLLPYSGSISQSGARGHHRDLPHIYVESEEISGFWRRSVGKKNVISHVSQQGQTRHLFLHPQQPIFILHSSYLYCFPKSPCLILIGQLLMAIQFIVQQLLVYVYIKTFFSNNVYILFLWVQNYSHGQKILFLQVYIPFSQELVRLAISCTQPK